ncbi:MAG: ABC transporter ATP-binding protein [Clostridia bacterium]|nr:ABC transporter ATP-binding protein [Clostridia bacterium]
MEAIRTEALSKYYGKARGITDVSLTVEQGGFYGFIGPNGAGKSTTIRLLLGLISATGGRAEVLGMDISRERTRILEKTGYLPSEAAFYGGMRVRDIIALSARLRKKDCAAEARRLCEKLELDDSRRVEELSLGNRKKVGIVCAMQHRPELYILDEPTSGLDPLMQQEFYALLRERNAEGATVFLSSHVLSEVARWCTHAAVIRDGRLLAADSVESLGHTGVKRVALRGAAELPELAGVRDTREENGTLTFLYGGKPAELLTALAALAPEDVTISDPDLEEVFMHYYAKGDA